MSIANRFLQGKRGELEIEDALVRALNEENVEFDFTIDGDWYDNSLEVYFSMAPCYPWEPSLATRLALCVLGFSMIYWNFPDGTEIRHDEHRRKKDAFLPVEDVGYVDERWDKSWIGGPYDCRGKI